MRRILIPPWSQDEAAIIEAIREMALDRPAIVGNPQKRILQRVS